MKRTSIVISISLFLFGGCYDYGHDLESNIDHSELERIKNPPKKVTYKPRPKLPTYREQRDTFRKALRFFAKKCIHYKCTKEKRKELCKKVIHEAGTLDRVLYRRNYNHPYIYSIHQTMNVWEATHCQGKKRWYLQYKENLK